MTVPQHLVALKKANEHKNARAVLHREVAAMKGADGMLRLADLLEDPPPEIMTLRAVDALRWVRRLGLAKTRRALRSLQMPEGLPVGAMTPRQRELMVLWLRAGS